MIRAFLRRRSEWLPTVLVLAAVLLAGGRLISLSVQQRADQMRQSAGAAVVEYGRSIETQLQKLAEARARKNQPTELDQLLSSLQLSRLINPDYDFELSKLDAAGAAPRVFVSTRLEPLQDGIAMRIRAPSGFSSDLPSGYLQLALRPKSGWY